jgi:hypothetical protein
LERNDLQEDARHFGDVLRSARLAHNLSLDVIQARTKLKRQFFEDLERNDLSKWPTSPFYRESYLRAYATAVGLDQREVVEWYRREHEAPQAVDVEPQPSRPRRLTPVTIPLILAVTLVVAYAMGRWTATEPVPEKTAVASPSSIVGTSGIQPANERLSDVVLPAEAVEPAEIEGELLITSTPRGAHVTVNDIGRGSTPVRVRFLPAGSYTVRFIRPGLPTVTRHVTISSSRPRAIVSAALSSLRATN